MIRAYSAAFRTKRVQRLLGPKAVPAHQLAHEVGVHTSTLKYQTYLPYTPFASLDEAWTWSARFVHGYNHEHLHSALRFVTPDDRHFGREEAILAERHRVYERARRRRPDRWSGPTRNWTPTGPVYLNPQPTGDSNPAELKKKPYAR